MESVQLWQDAGHVHLFTGLFGGGVRLCGDQGHGRGDGEGLHPPPGKKKQGEIVLEVAAKTLPFYKNYF